MSRGHSARHGRSRCCSKIGPHVRSHKKRSVVRADAERHGGKVVREVESFEVLVVDDGKDRQ
ncbi:MAG: hypothetical protein ABSC31_13645 [Acidimicrobiales bacterium]